MHPSLNYRNAYVLFRKQFCQNAMICFRLTKIQLFVVRFPRYFFWVRLFDLNRCLICQTIRKNIEFIF